MDEGGSGSRARALGLCPARHLAPAPRLGWLVGGPAEHGAMTLPQDLQEIAMREMMNAGDICNRSVTVAERKMPLVKAAQLMREHHVSCLVVVDETRAGRIAVGMLTDRDLVTMVMAKGLDPGKLLVEDVMGTEVITALADDSIKSLLEIMKRRGLRRLPVVTATGVLEGLITLDDLLPLMAEQLRDMAAIIEAEFWQEERNRP
jgi:CBS domain-containing protein